MRDAWLVQQSVEYIKRFIGLPYKWGGDDSIAGFDCSGLVVEMLQSVGIIPLKSDFTAAAFYNKFQDGTTPATDGNIRTGIREGMLVFFGKDEAVNHVGICLNSLFMIEAGGGNSKTKTREDAIKQNAYVRIRPIFSRSNTLGFRDPFLQE